MGTQATSPNGRSSPSAARPSRPRSGCHAPSPTAATSYAEGRYGRHRAHCPDPARKQNSGSRSARRRHPSLRYREVRNALSMIGRGVDDRSRRGCLCFRRGVRNPLGTRSSECHARSVSMSSSLTPVAHTCLPRTGRSRLTSVSRMGLFHVLRGWAIPDRSVHAPRPSRNEGVCLPR